MKKLILSVFVLSLVFQACKKQTGVEGPAGPAGNNGLNGNLLDTGTLTGTLAIYDEFGWPLTDSAGVVVSLKAGGVEKTSTTNSAGVYVFNGLGAGTYDLSYTKTGYGVMKMLGVAHTPGNDVPTTIPQVSLMQIPQKTAIDSLYKTDGSSYIYVNIILDTSSKTYVQPYENFVLLISKNPAIDISNTEISSYSQYFVPDGSGGYNNIIDKSLIGGQNHEGGTYYIRVGVYNRYVHRLKDPYYVFDTDIYGMYTDPDNGSIVYPNLKLSPTILTIQ